MPETIVFHALDLSGETTLMLFLRKADGTLLNAGGDALTEAGSTGVFTATLDESRVGLGPLAVRVCLATETAANLLYDGFLAESSLVVDEIGATQASVDNVIDTVSFIASGLFGAIANAGTATETYAITINGGTFTATGVGLDATGNRTSVGLVKS